MATDSGGSEQKSIREKIKQGVSDLGEQARQELKQKKSPFEAVSQREIAQQALAITLRRIAELRRIAALREGLQNVSNRLDRASQEASQRIERNQERVRQLREKEQQARLEAEQRRRFELLQEFTSRSRSPQAWEAEVNARGFEPASFSEDRRDLDILQAAENTPLYLNNRDAFNRLRNRLRERLQEDRLRSRLSRGRRSQETRRFLGTSVGQNPQEEVNRNQAYHNGMGRRGFTGEDLWALRRLNALRQLNPVGYSAIPAYEQLHRDLLERYRHNRVRVFGLDFEHPLMRFHNWQDQRDLRRRQQAEESARRTESEPPVSVSPPETSENLRRIIDEKLSQHPDATKFILSLHQRQPILRWTAEKVMGLVELATRIAIELPARIILFLPNYLFEVFVIGLLEDFGQKDLTKRLEKGVRNVTTYNWEAFLSWYKVILRQEINPIRAFRIAKDYAQNKNEINALLAKRQMLRIDRR